MDLETLERFKQTIKNLVKTTQELNQLRSQLREHIGIIMGYDVSQWSFKDLMDWLDLYEKQHPEKFPKKEIKRVESWLT